MGASSYIEILETCYNFKTLGTYGICKLNRNDGDASFTLGFCSRSCHYKDDPVGDPYDPYEEATFEYFEDAPSITLFASNYYYFCLIVYPNP